MTWCPACDINCDAYETVTKLVSYVRCKNCGTIFTAEDIVTLIANDNDKTESRNQNELMQVRLERVELFVDKIDRILDFGCGYGQFIAYLRGNGLLADGIDKTTELILANVKPNTYDVIYMIEVIEHLNRPGDTLELLSAALKEDGIIYIETTFADNIFDMKESTYVDATIGHKTILSLAGLQCVLPDTMMLESEFNANVVILRRRSL